MSSRLISSTTLSKQTTFKHNWIKYILDNYNYDYIKYDIKTTNTFLNFISENIKSVAKKVQIMINDFFIASCVIYTLSWWYQKNYKAIKNGILNVNSANCKFTFARIDNKNMFIKVVNTSIKSDYIINDIINCLLLEILYKNIKGYPQRSDYYNTPDIFTNYELKDFVNEFETSFSSFSTETNWDYNDLMKKKYTFDTFCQNNPLDNYNKKCHIFITNAINGKPETLHTIFKSYINNPSLDNLNMIIRYFSSLKHVYNYIYFMGFHYGFLHNDLHQGNLLFDTYIDKLTIIDYGRNYIGYFYDNRFPLIDNCVKNYHKILNYKNLYGEVIEPNNYRDMIEMYKNSTSLYSIIKSDNNGYMTHILDIITLSLSCLYYIDLIKNYQHNISGVSGNIQYDNFFMRLTNLIYFAKSTGANEYDDLINKNLIISITDTSMDLEEIIKTYMNTKIKILIDIGNNIDVDYNAFIYDGLFYTCLLLKYFQTDGDDLTPRNGGNIFYKSFQIIKYSSFITQDAINGFMNYLKNININHNYLSNVNIFFNQMNIMEPNTPITLFQGGKRNTTHHIKTKSISAKLQEVINKLNRNDNPSIQSPSFIEITDDTIEQYTEIFKDNIIDI